MFSRIITRAFSTSARPFESSPNSMVDLYSGTSSFELFSNFCKEMDAFDFGMGSPDSLPPEFLRDALTKVVMKGNRAHQYCRSQSSSGYASQIAKQYSQSFERNLDPKTEILTTAGATQAISNALYTFLKPGDEMVCFEPSFLGYAPLFHIVGPNLKWIHFRENKKERKFELDKDAFASSLSDKTKILFLNNPHNPFGKLFTEEDLLFIAEQIKKYPNLIVVSDEVYDKFVFNNQKFTRFAALPGMWERTISLYSSGKVFSCTGWRVGFSIAPEELTEQMKSWQTWSSFSMNHPAAKAMETGMKVAQSKPYEGCANYYEWLGRSFEWRAKKISEVLNNSTLDIKMYEPEGGYFSVGNIEETIKKVPIKYFYKEQAKGGEKTLNHFEDWKSLDSPDYTPDSACCIYFTKELGFTTVPISAFYDNHPHTPVQEMRGTNFVRFALCKQDDFLYKWEDELRRRGALIN